MFEIFSDPKVSSSSSSCHATSTDIPDPLSTLFPIIHRFWQVLRATSCILTELLYAGRPAFAQPCKGIHRRTSLMSSSLLLQQCPACLVHLTLIVFVRRGTAAALGGCCLQDLFQIARSILV